MVDNVQRADATKQPWRRNTAVECEKEEVNQQTGVPGGNNEGVSGGATQPRAAHFRLHLVRQRRNTVGVSSAHFEQPSCPVGAQGG